MRTLQDLVDNELSSMEVSKNFFATAHGSNLCDGGFGGRAAKLKSQKESERNDEGRSMRIQSTQELSQLISTIPDTVSVHFEVIDRSYEYDTEKLGGIQSTHCWEFNRERGSVVMKKTSADMTGDEIFVHQKITENGSYRPSLSPSRSSLSLQEEEDETDGMNPVPFL